MGLYDKASDDNHLRNIAITQEVVNVPTPGVPFAIRTAVLGARLCDVAAAAQGLQVLGVPRLAPDADRDDVIDLETAGAAALAAAVAIAIEDLEAEAAPAPAIDRPRPPAHATPR